MVSNVHDPFRVLPHQGYLTLKDVSNVYDPFRILTMDT